MNHFRCKEMVRLGGEKSPSLFMGTGMGRGK